MSAFTEANRIAFNNLSAEYNSKPWQLAITAQVSETLQAHKSWIGINWTDSPSHSQHDEVKLLDYACGTGSITHALGPSVTSVIGMDISENMVSLYNSAAQTSGLSPSHARAVVGDLCGENPPSSSLSGPEFHDFDLAVIGLGFHHFEDPGRAVRRLGERLKVGGVLVIVDFLPTERRKEDGGKHDFPEMAHTIKHNGFTREGIREIYENEGFVDFDMVMFEKTSLMELRTGTVEKRLFVAKGRRGPTV